MPVHLLRQEINHFGPGHAQQIHQLKPTRYLVIPEVALVSAP